MKINKKAANISLNSGFTGVQVVVVIGLVAVLSLSLFGLPSGVKNLFSGLAVKPSAGAASIVSFGDFSKTAISFDIDVIARTIYGDLTNVQSMSKADATGAKYGVCFENTTDNSGAEKDFYNVVANTSANNNACDAGGAATVKSTVSLPDGVYFKDPAPQFSKSVVFNHDGSIVSKGDANIKVYNTTGARTVTVNTLGVVTYTSQTVVAKPQDVVAQPIVAKPAEEKTAAVKNVDTQSTEQLSKIASGMANVMSSIQAIKDNQPKTLTSKPATVAQVTDGVPTAPFIRTISPSSGGKIYMDWLQPLTAPSSPLISYRIYRGFYPGGEALIDVVNPGTTTYTDSLTYGIDYFYRISAINKYGEGPKSNEVRISPALYSANTLNAYSNQSYTYGSYGNYGSGSTLTWP